MPLNSADFDPDDVARLEAEGWRAYYDRRWLRVLRLVAELNRAEFRMPYHQSLQAAYYIARATRAWAPVDHDVATVRRYIGAYYRLAGRYAQISSDPDTVADLEIKYWNVHRRLIAVPDKAPFIAAVAELHVALFGIDSATAHESALERVAASNLVDDIVLRRSTDVEGDWTRLEQHLRKCYRIVAAAGQDHAMVGAAS